MNKKTDLKKLIKELNKSTLSVRKVGKDRYEVKDMVEIDEPVVLSGEELRKEFSRDI